MLQCKNADEYWKELSRLRGDGYKKFQLEVRGLRSAFHAVEDPTIQDCEKTEKENNRLFRKCMSEAEDFVKYHLPQPLYVYKTKRKFYEVKYIREHPGLWVSSKPIDKQTITKTSNAWILPLSFSGNAVAVVPCSLCKRPFIRTHPNEKYCFRCHATHRDKLGPIIDDKLRYCQNPDCGKEIPGNRHGKAKYCKGGACRQAAYRKRKI